jgi:hypothetical protein
MAEESQDEIGAPVEAGKTPINAGAEIANTGGQCIAQVLLDIAMAPFLGMQVRGLRRQPVHLDCRMGLHIRFDHLRAMGVEPAPDEDKGAGNMSLEVTER